MGHKQLHEILGMVPQGAEPRTRPPGYFEKYGEPRDERSRLISLINLLMGQQQEGGENLEGDEELSVPGSPRDMERKRQYRFQNPEQKPGGEKQWCPKCQGKGCPHCGMRGFHEG